MLKLETGRPAGEIANGGGVCAGGKIDDLDSPFGIKGQNATLSCKNWLVPRFTQTKLEGKYRRKKPELAFIGLAGGPRKYGRALVKEKG